MITKQVINGEEVLMYSIGQLCAAIQRHPNSVRRLEIDGIIPAPFVRHHNNYRLYTAHEMRIIEYMFKTLNLRRGVKFPTDAGAKFKDLFTRLHQCYKNGSTDYPDEALTEAMLIARKANAQKA